MHRSSKLWSFYADLEESLGTLESACAVYDKMLELKVATPQIILNYALMLQVSGVGAQHAMLMMVRLTVQSTVLGCCNMRLTRLTAPASTATGVCDGGPAVAVAASTVLQCNQYINAQACSTAVCCAPQRPTYCLNNHPVCALRRQSTGRRPSRCTRRAPACSSTLTWPTSGQPTSKASLRGATLLPVLLHYKRTGLAACESLLSSIALVCTQQTHKENPCGSC